MEQQQQQNNLLSFTIGEYAPYYFQLFDRQASRYKENIFTRYYYQQQGEGISLECRVITYREMQQLIHFIAAQWKDTFLSSLYTSIKGSTCVAFLSDNPLQSIITMLTLSKLEIPYFPISTGNSKAAIIHLLDKTNVSYIIAGKKYGTMTTECVQQLRKSSSCEIGIKVWDDFDIGQLLAEATASSNLPMTTITPYKVVAVGKNVISDDNATEEANRNLTILHSSGTTSLPKPIHISVRCRIVGDFEMCVHHINTTWPEHPMTSNDIMIFALPLYHILGINLFFSTILVGASTVIFHHLPPSPQEVLFVAKTYGATRLATSPFILEQLVSFSQQQQNHPSSSNVLQKLIRVCIYGGAPLRPYVYDFFKSKGILMLNVYGTTVVSISDRNTIQPYKKLFPYFILEPYGDSTYHVVVRHDCPSLATGVGNRPNGDYATSDLIKEYPKGSGEWSIVGRMDDILVMKTGEKTNPTPMEKVICNEDFIRNCTIIGKDKECTGVLVELNVDNVSMMGRPSKQLISKVYEVIRKANKDAPAHSTIIVPNMVYILPLHKRLATTSKGTVRRQQVLFDFEQEIQYMYDAFLLGLTTSSSTKSPKEEKKENIGNENLVRQLIAQVLDRSSSWELDPKISLFDYGLDSLCALQLQHQFAIHFNMSIPTNFLFEHSTYHAIIQELFYFKHETKTHQQQKEKWYHQTQTILEGYLQRAESDFLPIPKKASQDDGSEPQQQHTILLTGATGSLGAFLLREMIQSSNVKKIYCWIHDTTTMMHRLEASFQQRGMDLTGLLQASFSMDKVEVISLHLDSPDLGLDQVMYAKLKKEITMIQCCGWLVDFHQPIHHYDRTCIQGLYYLLQFSYHDTHPMDVHFISSISATMVLIPEKPSPQDPRVAMPIGYSQSKYIVEHLFAYLSKHKNMPCFIERMGQVCGDLEHGIWNTSEQYPLLFAGGASLKMMPDMKNVTIDWLPVDYAARVIFETMMKTTISQEGSNNHDQGDEDSMIYHIVNPNRLSWKNVLDALKVCGMEFNVVEPQIWLDTLRQHQENQAYRLLPYFDIYLLPNNNDQKILTVWDTKKTVVRVPSLANAPVLDVDLLKKCLSSWKKVGFL
ncbi:hypothetical protein BDA99DRAFT_587258 [Phascolomyces articulosus]|uniref:Carrier domain-containing protein n=1 Tax=Phascolomyces articulosus TaxID=60185 RepID=A0AAD5JT41_9FUNG|nr:hypothetical protein BDA99DRAFT_587258 [Phascolomyces articulosus]